MAHFGVLSARAVTGVARQGWLPATHVAARGKPCTSEKRLKHQFFNLLKNSVGPYCWIAAGPRSKAGPHEPPGAKNNALLGAYIKIYSLLAFKKSFLGLYAVVPTLSVVAGSGSPPSCQPSTSAPNLINML